MLLTKFCKDSIRGICKWLSPPSFTDRYDEARGRRLPHTSEWIFDNSVYNAWLEHASHYEESSHLVSPSLWISGETIPTLTHIYCKCEPEGN